MQKLIDCEWYERINTYANKSDFWYGGVVEDIAKVNNEITYNEVKKFYDENENGLLQLGYRWDDGEEGHAVLITGAPEELDMNFYRERGYEFYPNNYYGYRIPIYDVNWYDQRYMYIKNDFSSIAFGDNEHITTVFKTTAEGDEQEYEDVDLEVNKINYSKILNLEEIIKDNGKIEIGSAKTYLVIKLGSLFKATNEDGEYVVTDGININDGSLECEISTKLGNTPDQQNKNISEANVVLDGGSDYSVETVNDTDALDINILTEDSYMLAKTTAGGKATFENKKAVSLSNPSGQEFETKITLNEEYVKLPWYTITATGKDAKEIKIEMTDEGALITGDNLKNVTVKGNNSKEQAELNISTDKTQVLIKASEDKTKMIASIDKDEDGIYETIIAEAKSVEITDNTEAPTKLPNTGINTILTIIIGLVAALGLLFALKYFNLRNI